MGFKKCVEWVGRGASRIHHPVGCDLTGGISVEFYQAIFELNPGNVVQAPHEIRDIEKSLAQPPMGKHYRTFVRLT